MELLRDYWSVSLSKLLESLKSGEHGLTNVDAQHRLLLYGQNVITEKSDHLLLFFAKQFFNPLILLLLFASVISAIFGEISDCIIISTIVVVSATIDFFQQYRAKLAAEALRQQVALTASVIRDAKTVNLPVADLVAGDVITLSPGNVVPADCRLLESHELVVNESSLTGESNSVEKDAQSAVEAQAGLPDRRNCVFMATHIISGSATAVVVCTGKVTAFGQIAQTLLDKQPEHAFEHGLKHFGFLIMKLTLVLVLVVFFINAFFKHEVLQSFIFALALAVGLTPELLPIILTLNLSRGALRMAKKGVIVKHLPAIQDFGSMSILCTDKTGTLTEDRIELELYEDMNRQSSEDVFLYGYINSHFLSSLKSPIERAVLAHENLHIKNYQKIDEIPFDFQRRSSSVVVAHAMGRVLVTKGALDHILPQCEYYVLHGKEQRLTKSGIAHITDRFEELSNQGFRVLAIAKKSVNDKTSYTQADETDLTFLGLMAFLDPPKKSAKQALAKLHEQGVSIKVITGDNELVTKKICADLCLTVTGILRGDVIDSYSDTTLEKLAKHTTIFARISPIQKQRIIVCLKRSGAVVGYLGDGINDAPSLKAADIGISVNNAVDIAKDTASLILLHKDLHVLKEGVLEGRKTYANIMKYIMMGASSNFGNMFSVAGASIFLKFLPMLPVQILLNNLLYDIAELAIPTDNVDPEALKMPQQWDVEFIKRFMLVFGPISSLFDFLTFFVLLAFLHVDEGHFQTGWFIESLLSQAIVILAIRTVKTPFFTSRPSWPLLAGTIALVSLTITLPFLPIAHFFSFKPLPPSFYGLLVIIIGLYIGTVEIVKRWFYRQHKIAPS